MRRSTLPHSQPNDTPLLPRASPAPRLSDARAQLERKDKELSDAQRDHRAMEEAHQAKLDDAVRKAQAEARGEGGRRRPPANPRCALNQQR